MFKKFLLGKAAVGADAGLILFGPASYTERVDIIPALHQDSSDNYIFNTKSSEPTIYGYQGIGIVSIAGDGTYNFQRNIDQTTSNDQSYGSVYDGTSFFSLGYGFYDGSTNATWFIKNNGSTGANQDFWKMTWTNYYLGYYRAGYKNASDQIYVVGQDYVSGSTNGWKILFGDFDPVGDTLTSMNYHGGSNNNGTKISAAAFDGTYWYLSGESAEMGQSQDLSWVGKFSATGSQQWLEAWGTSSQNNYGSYGIDFDSSGNSYAAIRYRNTGTGRWEPVLMKLNSSGTRQWSMRLSYDGANIGSIFVDSNDDLFITGQWRASSVVRMFVAQISTSDGSVTWVNQLVAQSGATSGWQTYDISSSGVQDKMIDNSDGNLVIAFKAANSSLVKSQAGGILSNIAKDGTEYDFGTELMLETTSMPNWSSYNVSAKGSKSLSTGSFSSTVTNYTSLPSGWVTSTTEFSTYIP